MWLPCSGFCPEHFHGCTVTKYSSTHLHTEMVISEPNHHDDNVKAAVVTSLSSRLLSSWWGGWSLGYYVMGIFPWPRKSPKCHWWEPNSSWGLARQDSRNGYLPHMEAAARRANASRVFGVLRGASLRVARSDCTAARLLFKMDDEKCRLLIDLYKDHRSLLHPQHKNYRNSARREDSWKEINK
jgi:hypothetical protein